MGGELEDLRIELDGGPLTLEHGAFEVVIQNDPGDTPEGYKRFMVCSQEVRHTRIEKEAEKDLARIGEHHDEAHEFSPGAAYLKGSEVCPVALHLFAG